MKDDFAIAMVIGAGLVVLGAVAAVGMSDDTECPDPTTNPWFPVHKADDTYIRNFVDPDCWTDDLAAAYQAQLDEFVGDRKYHSHISRSMDGKHVMLRVFVE